jgi:hypothetical protein
VHAPRQHARINISTRITRRRASAELGRITLHDNASTHTARRRALHAPRQQTRGTAKSMATLTHKPRASAHNHSRNDHSQTLGAHVTLTPSHVYHTCTS